MNLDNISNQIYIVAINEAKLQAHEYILPEHFLYASLMFDIGKEIISSSGGIVELIISDLQIFFEKYSKNKGTDDPIQSFSFMKMFEIAAMNSKNIEEGKITIGNLLVSIFSLKESYACYILLKNNTNKLAMLKYISHELKEETIKKNDKNSDDLNLDNKNILDKFTQNITEKAKKGLLDKLIGREDIMDRTIQVLCRRLKNNPLHVGNPGVGKTSIIEGLAKKIVDGSVPEQLLNANIYFIDIATVIAGTKYRGDFEERLLKILEAIKKTEKPIIYFDEIHTIVGAGAVSGGGMDATSILKPFLARGDIKFIGTTTFEEYKKYIEKDRALSRRFQRIDIEEPSVEETIKILQGIKDKYEEYHKVIYTDKIIRLVCELTNKYMNDRYLPDKAIDAMDETGAYIRMKNKNGFEKVVTAEDIERTISLMVKVPASSLSTSEVKKVQNLEKSLKQNIFGQEKAIESVVSCIKLSKSGLNDMDKPIASLLFVGPTGVGKTEIAKQLATNLGIKLIRYDMSEYQEKHSIAKLIGSPPGYVGFEEGGLITEEIKKTPHCVLLLDEIEKAHSDILNVMLQIMDYGILTDNRGKKTDFKNVIIIMTSNAGAKELGKKVIGFEEKVEDLTRIDKEVEKAFSPEFRNRLDSIVVFNHINKEMAVLIAKKALDELVEKLKNKKIDLKLTDNIINYIALKGLSEKYGAREIIRVVKSEIKKLLVEEILFGELVDGGSLTLDYLDGLVNYYISK